MWMDKRYKYQTPMSYDCAKSILEFHDFTVFIVASTENEYATAIDSYFS